MAGLNLTKFTTDLQKFIHDNANLTDQRIVNDWSFVDHVEYYEDQEDEMPLTSIFIEDVLQPGNKDTFDPTDEAINISDRVLKMRDVKVDIQLTRTEILKLENSYLNKIAELIGQGTISSAAEFPFFAYIIERIQQKVREDAHLKAVYKGVFNNAGNTPADTVDGKLTLLANDIVSGDIPVGNVFIGAAFTDTNAVKQVEDQLAIVPEKWWGHPELIVEMSPKVHRLFSQDYRNRYGDKLDYRNFNQTRALGEDGPMFIVDPGMAGSERVIVGFAKNTAFGVKDLNDFSSYMVEKFERTVKIMMDAQMGLNYGVAAHHWLNDQL